MTDPTVTLVLTTVASETAAQDIARHLLERGVIACASMTPLRSVYRWEGAVRDEGEVQLVLKTTKTGVAALIEAVERIHPYDLPEILVLEAGASAAYASWVDEEVDH